MSNTPNRRKPLRKLLTPKTNRVTYVRQYGREQRLLNRNVNADIVIENREETTPAEEHGDDVHADLERHRERQEAARRNTRPAINDGVAFQRARTRKLKQGRPNIAREVDTINFVENDISIESHSCGQMTVVCTHCKALRWTTELASFCCQNGKVNIPLPPPPPPNIAKFYDWNNRGKDFIPHSRIYNNALALASIGCNEKLQKGFSPTFTIQGKLCHRMGSLLPPTGTEPKFAQIFFIDTNQEVAARIRSRDILDEAIVEELQVELQRVNSYVRSFRSAIDICRHDKVLQIVLYADKKSKPSNSHQRTYNLPTSGEVAALMPGESAGNLDIILRCRDGEGSELRRIHTCHRSYDPLHYVLIFPYGTDGWHLGLKKTDNRTLTAADFYCHRLQIRDNDVNIVMILGRLTQQYAVDQWVKVENGRLEWARSNQKSIRAEKYQGLLDAVHGGDSVNAGQKIILPPTIYGSPRFYAEAFQSAMAIVRHFGKPDIFITFTCNPKWEEISSALNRGEKPCDRPDLTARVFKMKFDSLMDDLIKRHLLGVVRAYTCTIEFQKRGLPHVHILLIMDNEAKPNNADKINKIVCAEIPDKNINPKLHEIVTSAHIHGPCGHVNPDSPCMEENGTVRSCSKQFPKRFAVNTSITENSYPTYRRRHPDDGGQTHRMKIKGQDFIVDNSFVVPYNPLLTLRYQAHINVEIVHSVQAVKYLYKYITKGQDRILFNVEDDNLNDEISRYINARYISASEAFWRIYGFEIHRRYPPVEKLPCHLPNEQTVLFQSNEAEHVVAGGPPVTKLTAFFASNAQDVTARHILYPEYPRFFTWNSKEKKWQRRKKGVQIPGTHEVTSECIGRIPTVPLNPHQAELYYLRLLLHHRAGAVSFDDLRTINETLHPTYQAACNALGLLEDDTEKDKAMEEAAAIRFGSQLRAVFATILIYCRPADPLQFWEKHKLELARDIMNRDNTLLLTPRIENEVLQQLQIIFDAEGLDLEKDFHLPRPQRQEFSLIPKVIQEELDYDRVQLRASVEDKYTYLNAEQKHVFDTISSSVLHKNGLLFALDASGGTGKTFVINLLLSSLRSLGKIALATAMSGIAANLLLNGRTFHSRFKVPITVTENSTCSMSPADAVGKLMQLADFIVIDEVSMGHKYVFEALDRSLRDIRKNDKTFGGLTVLFAGDWRQVLPVVRHGSRAEIVNATLKMSPLWDAVRVLSLTRNMRVTRSEESPDFAEFLLKLGNGEFPIEKSMGEHRILIPPDLVVPTKNQLTDFVFGDLLQNFMNIPWLSSRAIICPTNASTDEMNDHIMSIFPGEERQYTSSDSVDGNEHQYPLEFINKLCPSGLPPHRLRLKRHSIIMLLRNLDPQNGHCNGTRYIIEQMHDHVIDAIIASGPHAGKRLFIPRIPLIPSESLYPFQMRRKQFPVRPAFAITANKAQGQTLNKVGVYLQTPFFSHGQLYVAASRVGARDSLRVFPANSESNGSYYTDNVVYPEVLRR